MEIFNIVQNDKNPHNTKNNNWCPCSRAGGVYCLFMVWYLWIWKPHM